MIKIIKHLFQAIFIYLFFITGRILGIKKSRKIFAKLFFWIGPFFKSKNIVKKNLDIFSDHSKNINRKKIYSSMWKNYGMTFIEYIFLDKLRQNNSHIILKGEEVLKKVIDDQKPAIFVSGHFANFELMSMEITKNNIELATIYRPLNNIFLNPLMEYLRKKYVCNNQIKKGINGVRDAINYLKNNCSIALMIDQRVSEGEKIELFGKPAYTTTLPAQLAIKYNLSIIPVFIERVNNENFKIEFMNEINSQNFKDKVDLTKKLNLTLEKMILKNPNQWIWTHDRWK